ncbi:uncharacterized protein LOC116676646 [Etheostoma spectabile]|uniref:uncharacterized protein LOC116676646 n=1 Tax=Etheostoma spectabile TaxID=54343 RepID=UPI0013AF1D0F|nr:uncharacterized protein LOC116676646 [Etheostoma spectabile]
MAYVPRRRWSKNLRPDLSELMNTFITHATSFIRRFANSEEKMRQIEGEFRKIADGVREIQEGAGRVITAGAVAGGLGLGATVGLGILVVAAWFTGGVSLAVGLLAVAVGLLAGGGTVARGAAVVFGGNVTKAMKENGSAKKVEELGKEFMEMVEPLKNNLEKIKKTCEKLEDRSAELQAGKTLTDMEDFQRILGQVPELAPSSGVVWSKKLGNTIIQSADLCQKVLNDLEKMREEL